MFLFWSPGAPYFLGRSPGALNPFGTLMDDLDLINSVEQVEVMVNSIQKGAENQKNFCSCNAGEFARCLSDLFHTFPKQIKFA